MEKVLTGTDSVADAADLPAEARLVDRLRGRAVVLVGLMGAGKTTVGRRLAARLGLAFRDADHEIEDVSRMPIADYFASYGEPSFRDLEKRVVVRLLREQTGLVLATGGGAYMNGEIRACIAERAVSIWLKADHETLMRRVRRRGHRPLLKTADPEATMLRLMAERYPVYEQADVTVRSHDTSHEKVTQDVLDALAEHLSAERHFGSD